MSRNVTKKVSGVAEMSSDINRINDLLDAFIAVNALFIVFTSLEIVSTVAVTFEGDISY